MGLARVLATSQDTIDTAGLGAIRAGNHRVEYTLTAPLDARDNNPTLNLNYFDSNGNKGPSYSLNKDGFVGQGPQNPNLVRDHAVRVLNHIEENAGKTNLGSSPDYGVELVTGMREAIANQVRAPAPGVRAPN